MADTYANFADLAAHEVYGVDYYIDNTDVVGARILCMAIHGGGIEVGSTELAYELSRLGSKPRKYYSFVSTKPAGQNSTMHITSTNFDEPQALVSVTDAYRCVSFHGYFDVVEGDQICYMGGRDSILRDRIAKKLNARGIIAQEAPSTVIGKEPGNIANRTRINGGVQLEMTSSLRAALFVNGNRQNKTPLFWTFLAAVNEALLEVEMGKQSGLGDQLYVDAIDLSGDIGSISRIGGGPAAMDVTAIDKGAPERIGGRREGAIEFTSWFNPSAGQAHKNFSTLPYSDRLVTYMRGSAVGNAAASEIAKQINYDPSRGADGALSMAVSAQSNGYGVEWGLQALAGKQTDSITYVASDVFSRTVSNGLGTADNGGAYSTGGGSASDFNVDGSAAVITLSSVNVTRRATLPVSLKNVDITATIKFNQASTGGFVAGGLYARYVDTNNHVTARLEASSSGSALNLTVTKLVSGVSTDLVTSVTTGMTYVVGTEYRMRLVLVDDQRKVKIWVSGNAEPTTWLLDTTDTSNNASGGVGFRAISSPSNSNTNPTVSFDSMRAVAPLRGNPVDFLTASRFFGLQLYYHLFAFTGNQVLLWLEHSSDDNNNDPYTEIPGTFIGPITTPPYSVRIATSDTQQIKRYVRLGYSTTTGLTSITHALQIVKNDVAVKF